MSILERLLLGGAYPFLYAPMSDDGGSGGGSDDGDDGDDGDQDDGDDGGSDDNLVDKNKIFGKEGGDDGDDEKKEGDDKEPEDKAERPDFIKEKFWDAEKGEPRLEAMAKAYDDLEKKLGNNKKAPDEYKIELDENMEKIFDKTKVDDDPLLNWFKGYAKENNFSQEMFNDALKGFAESSANMLDENAVPEIDQKAEREKLGKNSAAIIKDQTNFLEQLFKQGHVNEDQMNEILILTETAAGFQALQAVRKYYGDSQKIPTNLTPTSGVKSADELREMQANSKYGSDPEYTEMVDKEYEKKYGTGNSGESLRSAL